MTLSIQVVAKISNFPLVLEVKGSVAYHLIPDLLRSTFIQQGKKQHTGNYVCKNINWVTDEDSD